MSTVQVNAQLSSEELLKAVGRLSLPELEQFVSQVIALQAHRKAPGLPRPEAELLLHINQGMPADLQERYAELIDEREAGTLAEHEHSELLRLTAQVEELEARRVEYLAELARLRKTSLTALLNELGIPTPAYA